MCIFGFSFQGGPGIILSEHAIYKSLQNGERPEPDLPIKERQKTSVEGLEGIFHGLPWASPALATLLNHCGFCGHVVSKCLKNICPKHFSMSFVDELISASTMATDSVTLFLDTARVYETV